MTLNIKKIQERIDDKRKILLEKEDVEKLNAIEELIKIDNVFYKIETDVIVGMLEFLDFNESEIVEILSSEFSMNKSTQYENSQYIINQEEIRK